MTTHVRLAGFVGVLLLSASVLAHETITLQFEIYRKHGGLVADQRIEVEDSGTGTITLVEPETAVTFTATRLTGRPRVEKTALAFTVNAGAKVFSPRLVLDGRKAAWISWSTTEGESFELRVWRR
jgi:hypothetical protein